MDVGTNAFLKMIVTHDSNIPLYQLVINKISYLYTAYSYVLHYGGQLKKKSKNTLIYILVENDLRNVIGGIDFSPQVTNPNYSKKKKKKKIEDSIMNFHSGTSIMLNYFRIIHISNDCPASSTS